jgi:hypothetical protein
MIGFPIDELLSEEECYQYLKRSLHPEGLSCPNGHELPSDQAPHDRRREPIVDYRCRECGAVFNIFTDTVWSKTHYDCWATRDASSRICEGNANQMAG